MVREPSCIQGRCQIGFGASHKKGTKKKPTHLSIRSLWDMATLGVAHPFAPRCCVSERKAKRRSHRLLGALGCWGNGPYRKCWGLLLRGIDDECFRRNIPHWPCRLRQALHVSPRATLSRGHSCPTRTQEKAAELFPLLGIASHSATNFQRLSVATKRSHDRLSRRV